MIYQKTLHQHTSFKYFHHWPPKFDQDIIISKPFFAAHNWCYCLHFLFTLGIISKPGAWGWMNVTYIDLDDLSKYKYRVQMCVGSSFFLNVFVIPVLTTILTYGSFKQSSSFQRDIPPQRDTLLSFERLQTRVHWQWMADPALSLSACLSGWTSTVSCLKALGYVMSWIIIVQVHRLLCCSSFTSGSLINILMC